MKEKYRAFKEWKKNPRHHALYQLLCWFIFFFTLYLIAISGIFSPHYQSTTNTKKNNNSIENYQEMKSYEYKYEISYDNKNIIIEGIAFKDKNYYSIGENKYYDDGTLYLVDEENKQLIANPDINLPILLSEIDNNIIYTWLSEASINETIEYNSGDKVTTYDWSKDNVSITMIAKENDNIINNLELDLSEFVATKGLQYEQFKVNITYTNANNISSYTKNYDEYTVIGEDDEINQQEENNRDDNINEPQVRPLTEEEV